jgi:heterodisulfide reductase subunit D
MLDACTRCGKCVEACPVKTPAGVAAPAQEVITGVIDILRGGGGPTAARRWASTCMLTGDCIKACEEGVNPRFLLAMARLAIAKAMAPRECRREGVEGFRKLNLDVTVQSRMQAGDDVLVRLGQKVAAGAAASGVAPDFVFYTGCNLLKTPHIALLALDIMDALGVTYKVMGGPTRAHPLLRRDPAAHRRHRHIRQHGREYHGQAGASRAGAVVVPELPPPVFRSDDAGL